MLREEAIKALKGLYDGSEAILMAIEALKHERTDEWCPGCKEYDTEKKCCPRFNKVIREALKREPSDDGTLEVKVEDATKIGRVLISDDKHRGGLYYPDEDEPQGDLISRNEAFEVLAEILDENHVPIWICDKMAFALDAIPSADRPTDGDLISRQAAIEAMGEEPPVWCDEEYEIAERDQWRADIEAIKSVPSADRQMVIKCKPFLSEEDFKAFAEQASDQNVILISNEAEVVSTNTSTNTSTKSTNISIDAPADRPRGEWTTDEVAELLANIFGDECACNWNGNDEWLPEVCKYAETTCPSPKEANGCWKQFLIQGGARRK